MFEQRRDAMASDVVHREYALLAGDEACRLERTLGGFPFRLELRCSDPRMDVSRDDGSFTASAKSIVAVAQVYDPMHVIVEATGPLLFIPSDGQRQVEANWTSAEASSRLTLLTASMQHSAAWKWRQRSACRVPKPIRGG